MSGFNHEGRNVKTSLSAMPLDLISENEIRQKLVSVFTESIVLTNQFEIDHVSHDILDALGYRLSELKGMHINQLHPEMNIQRLLLGRLDRGFFGEIILALHTRHSHPVIFNITGFYLGVITDMNGYIVLNLKNLDRKEHIAQAENDREELDRFIYRAAHDLRGPLATIRGLLNLLKIRKDDDEIDVMVAMLDSSAERLDERLFKLLYLAESGEAELPTGELHIAALEKALRETREQNCPLQAIEVEIISGQPVIQNIHEHLVQSLLTNIMQYMVCLPRQNHPALSYTLSSTVHGLEVRVQALGFELDYNMQQVLQQRTSLYSGLLAYPNLINYYAARKIALSLGATMNITFLAGGVQEIYVAIPFYSATRHAG